MSGRSVKNKRIEESLKQILKIKNIISITVLNLMQIQNLDLSEYLRQNTHVKMHQDIESIVTF